MIHPKSLNKISSSLDVLRFLSGLLKLLENHLYALEYSLTLGLVHLGDKVEVEVATH